MAWLAVQPAATGTTAGLTGQDGITLHRPGRLLHLLHLLPLDHLGQGHVTHLTINQSQLY